MSENLLVSSEELGLKSEAEKLQVLQRMPVIIMKSREIELFVNIHKLAFTPDLFDTFINSDKTVDFKGDGKGNTTEKTKKRHTSIEDNNHWSQRFQTSSTKKRNLINRMVLLHNPADICQPVTRLM